VLVTQMHLNAAIRVFLFAGAIGLAPLARVRSAEQAGSAVEVPAAKAPLAAKQQIVRDRMTQLEDRMFRLQQRLAESEADQARRLEAALRRARELLIGRNMDEVIALLERAQLTAAADRQLAITDGLGQVLKILLEDLDNTKERKKEIDRHKDFRDRIAGLLERQRGLKTRTDAAGRRGQLQVAIQDAVARIEALIGRQQKEIDKTTAAAGTNDPAAARVLGGSQKQIRLDAQALAGDLRNLPGILPPTGTLNGETETESRGARDGEQASLEPDIRKAADEVERSAEQMRMAEDDLDRGAAGDAAAMQEEAVELLRRALRQLKQQEEAARELLDQAEAAGQQRKLKRQADQLAEDMHGPSPGRDAKSGGQHEGDQPAGAHSVGQLPPGPPAPGAQNVEQAGEHMESAAGALDREQPSQASENQQRAIEELQRAQDALQQTLDQMRREQQEEILRGLESRFRAMLAQQLAVNKGTGTLDSKGRDAWTHGDELTLAGLARDEQSLVDQAGQVLEILKEEGTTIVFPRIVEQLRQDMVQLTGRLRDRQTGAETQRMEADIATALEELIDAVKQLQQELQEGEGGAGGGGGSPPLLPDSAELKLLRSCQQRVNRQTLEFHKAYREAGERDAQLREGLNRIAERQRELADMARKMNERITGQ